MSYLKQNVNPQHAQDRKLEKLQQSLHNIEQQMSEQHLLRRKLEAMGERNASRTQQALERANSRNKILQDEIDKVQGSQNSSPTPLSNKMVDEIISKRTKDFQRSQATKAATIQYLAQERQRILEARNRLQERKDNLRSIPSPVGKATQRTWGHKYSCYRPMYYDDYLRIYSPRFQDGYYTLFPRPSSGKHKEVGDNPDDFDHQYEYARFLAKQSKKGTFHFMPIPLHKAV